MEKKSFKKKLTLSVSSSTKKRSDKIRYAMQTQLFFLLSRYKQHQDLQQIDMFANAIVSDYMFDKDRLFAALNLSDMEDNLIFMLVCEYKNGEETHIRHIKYIIENSNAIQTLEKLKGEGKIIEIGISVRSPDDAVIALEKFNFSVIQVNFNMIDQRALDNGLFNLAKENFLLY